MDAARLQLGQQGKLVAVISGGHNQGSRLHRLGKDLGLGHMARGNGPRFRDLIEHIKMQMA